MGGRCQCCANRNEEVLVFHHQIATAHLKSFEMSAGYGLRKPLDKVLDEASLCMILCMNCHALVHAGILQEPDLITPVINITEEEWRRGWKE